MSPHLRGTVFKTASALDIQPVGSVQSTHPLCHISELHTQVEHALDWSQHPSSRSAHVARRAPHAQSTNWRLHSLSSALCRTYAISSCSSPVQHRLEPAAASHGTGAGGSFAFATTGIVDVPSRWCSSTSSRTQHVNACAGRSRCKLQVCGGDAQRPCASRGASSAKPFSSELLTAPHSAKMAASPHPKTRCDCVKRVTCALRVPWRAMAPARPWMPWARGSTESLQHSAGAVVSRPPREA